MTGIYWYASHQKIDALRHAYTAAGLDWLKELSIKLKAPFVEAGTKLRFDQTFYRDLERIREAMLKLPETASLTDLSAKRTATFIAFSGNAHRAIEEGVYWVILFENSTALLLAGSASNAVAVPPKVSADISPSADPIGAVRKAFADQRSPEDVKNVSRNCSYVWQVIARPVRNQWDQLPRVEGIAVFGGMFPANQAQFRRAGFSDVERIVIGSPIYVRQI